jgi:hypothetical protein
MLMKGSALKIEHATYAVDTIALELDLKFSFTNDDISELQAFMAKREKEVKKKK